MFGKITFILFFSINLLAEIGIGSGYSATTSGRPVPLIYLSLGINEVVATASSTGIKNSIYYHSAWKANLFYTHNLGEFLWDEIDLGLGWGVYYATKGYRTSLTSNINKSNDFITGPAMRITWNILSPFFFSIETLYGLSYNPIQHLLLAFRVHGSAIIGVRF